MVVLYKFDVSAGEIEAGPIFGVRRCYQRKSLFNNKHPRSSYNPNPYPICKLQTFISKRAKTCNLSLQHQAELLYYYENGPFPDAYIV